MTKHELLKYALSKGIIDLSACSKLISAGLDEKLITHQMGHVDISTSEKYYNYNIYDSKETVELITSALG